MPIERQGPLPPEAEVVEESSEAVSRLPKSILGGKDVAVGDVVRVEVVDLGDDDFGVKYAKETVTEEPKGGVSKMAAEFD